VAEAVDGRGSENRPEGTAVKGSDHDPNRRRHLRHAGRLPEAWAGLTDAALEAASGVPGAKFCHNSRFIAVASKRDAIIQMADLAIAKVA